MPDLPARLHAFEERIGHRFRDPDLLLRALSHPSILQDDAEATHNQRLEFLGDAVLQLILTEKLMELFPTEREGVLTRRRAALTRGVFLAELAHELGVPNVLQVSTAERANRGHLRPGALEDAVEALVAAIFLDVGWEQTRDVVLGWYGDIAMRIEQLENEINPKGRLQEIVQPRHGNGALRYITLRAEGPPHDRHFAVEVRLFDRPLGQGEGRSKKSAEEAAARIALKTLETEGV